MPQIAISIDSDGDDVLTTRINVNKLIKKGPTSKAELCSEIVKQWIAQHEHETYATADELTGGVND